MLMLPALNTSLVGLLGCRYPVIQTAMGWVATPELVAASCNAGAFGFLAAAVMQPQQAAEAIDRVKQLTDRPFGVNFHMFQPGAEEIVDLVIAQRVCAVSYGRGPDAATITRFKEAGVLCIPTVGALKHAQKAELLGADAIVVQGGEGGGHTGSVASTVLLPQVLAAVGVPVVAAGGFRDGRGLVAALAFGAAGIAMGTRFLLTAESPVPDITKQRYLEAASEEILVSTKLDGIPQRMIRNRELSILERSGYLRTLLRAVRSGLAYRQQTGVGLLTLLRSALQMRRAQGLSLAQTMMAANAPMIIQQAMVNACPDAGVLPSGQVAGAIDSILDCEQLLRTLMREAEHCIGALTGTRG